MHASVSFSTRGNGAEVLVLKQSRSSYNPTSCIRIMKQTNWQRFVCSGCHYHKWIFMADNHGNILVYIKNNQLRFVFQSDYLVLNIMSIDVIVFLSIGRNKIFLFFQIFFGMLRLSLSIRILQTIIDLKENRLILTNQCLSKISVIPLR